MRIVHQPAVEGGDGEGLPADGKAEFHFKVASYPLFIPRLLVQPWGTTATGGVGCPLAVRSTLYLSFSTFCANSGKVFAGNALR